MIDLDKLEDLARQATPGPWVVAGAGWDQRRGLLDACGGEIADFPYERASDAAYIAAASPDIVLKLIAVARAAKAVDKAADPVPVGDTEAALASVRAISAAMRAIHQALAALEEP